MQGAGFRVQGSRCRVQGSGFRVQGAGERESCLDDEGVLVNQAHLLILGHQ